MGEKMTFRQIFLSKWVPALITAGIGGLVVALLVPMFQTDYAEKAALKKRKIELWESIGNNFTNYMTFRSSLNTAALSEREMVKEKKFPSKEFLERKESYRRERDRYANDLRRDFLLAGYYFGSEIQKEINAFLNWHRQYRIATVDKLPPDEEYAKWRDKIMLVIRSQLQ